MRLRVSVPAAPSMRRFVVLVVGWLVLILVRLVTVFVLGKPVRLWRMVRVEKVLEVVAATFVTVMIIGVRRRPLLWSLLRPAKWNVGDQNSPCKM